MQTFQTPLTLSCRQHPALRLMYLYLLTLAQNTPRLDVSQRPTTAAELKWGCVDTKRKRSDRIVNDPVADGDSDDGAEDNNRNAASGKGKEKADDADANHSVDTAGADRPSAHTRSKDVKPPVQHASVKTRNVSRTHALCTLRADCEQWLTQLPLFARPSLDHNTIRIGKNYVVRLQLPSLLLLGNRVVFVLHCMLSKHTLAARIAGGILCALLAATYTIDVKAKDCSPYTHIISCSHLCCVTNQHDHAALTLAKVNLSVLAYVVQSPRVVVRGVQLQVVS